MPILLTAMALLGLCVGSFLNVVVHRVPAGESIVAPGSHCPACNAAIRARHNVPVVGWLLLHGRCADCATPISVRYPLVELVTGVLFAGVTYQADRLDLLPALPALLAFVGAGVALAAIDLDVMRLPNIIVYPTLAVVAALLTTASAVTGDYAPLVRAGLGALATAGFFLALVVANPRGMGRGDVKLAAIIGAVLGFVSYPALVVGVFLAFVVGTILGAFVLLAGHAGRKTKIPFGPALIAGAVVAFFAAAPITDAYAAVSQLT